MKEWTNVAIFSIGFLWLGLLFAPGAGPTSEIVKVGIIGTVGALLGFALIVYSKREKRGSTARHGA